MPQAPMTQVPRFLQINPDGQQGSQTRYAARFLMRTHFIACLEEAPEDFKPYEVLTLQDLDAWFPDQSRILSHLPPTWTVQAVADLLKCSPIQLPAPICQGQAEAAREHGRTYMPQQHSSHIMLTEARSHLLGGPSAQGVARCHPSSPRAERLRGVVGPCQQLGCQAWFQCPAS